MFDLLIHGGDVIDGSGRPRIRADIGIRGGLIAAVGDLANSPSAVQIPAAGKVLAPGFIDVHTHADAWVKKRNHFTEKTLQGFTTEVLMADGISYAPVNRKTIAEWVYYLRSLNGLTLEEYTGWESLADYMQLLDRTTAQNTATHVPYANVRSIACGFTAAAPAADQMREIKRMIAEGMEQGAVGLSTGLEYLGQTFCSTEEIAEACTAIAPYDGLYVTHIRYPLGLVAAVREAVEIGKRAKVRVHISHLKTTDPRIAEELLTYINTVAMHEVDFTFDVYPYAAASTMLNYLLPHEDWTGGALALKAKLRHPDLLPRFEALLATENLTQAYIAWTLTEENKQYQGRPLSDYVAASGQPPAQALLKLLEDEDLSVLLVFRRGADEAAYDFVAHERYLLGTDGVFHPGGVVHPRMFGSSARILGPMVRDAKRFSLEAAVRKMTGFSAETFRLPNRGTLAPGAAADVVVFDPSTVADRATYENPTELPLGIESVIVNGVPIVRDASAISRAVGSTDSASSAAPGRFVRCR